MNPTTTHLHNFEGQALVTLTWNGRPCWIARHIGACIGYSQGGKRIPSKILGDWSDEFIAGKDYLLLQGEDLVAFQHSAPQDDGGTFGRGSLLVLFESGVFLLLAKTALPLGVALRRFLVDEVLPQLAREGRYQPRPAPELDPNQSLFAELKPRPIAPRRSAQEQRLSLQAHTRAAWVDLCDRRLQVRALQRFAEQAGDYLTPGERLAVELLAAEIATGLPLAEVLGDGPGDDPGTGLAPTRNAAA